MLDNSIAQPIWPTLGILIGLSLLFGAVVGRIFGQWRMFVFFTAFGYVGLDYLLRLVPFWIDLLVMGGGMMFVVVAWFRERNRLMPDGVTAEGMK